MDLKALFSSKYFCIRYYICNPVLSHILQFHIPTLNYYKTGICQISVNLQMPK
jgi:hypothetical protein